MDGALDFLYSSLFIFKLGGIFGSYNGLSKEEGIDIFYFSSFDESWKVDSEGDVGSYWGIWDKDEQLKFQN